MKQNLGIILTLIGVIALMFIFSVVQVSQLRTEVEELETQVTELQEFKTEAEELFEIQAEINQTVTSIFESLV